MGTRQATLTPARHSVSQLAVGEDIGDRSSVPGRSVMGVDTIHLEDEELRTIRPGVRAQGGATVSDGDSGGDADSSDSGGDSDSSDADSDSGDDSDSADR
jgi:hypothetical protein